MASGESDQQRQRRTDALTSAAKRKSELKIKAAETAIRSLIKSGEPITFQAVQRRAGVSHSFLYSNPALRERIERLRRQQAGAQAPKNQSTTADRENNIVIALTAEIAKVKRLHHDQTQALRSALEQAHGENLALRRELAHLGWTDPAAK
jgi:hypothetical protein